MQQEQQQNNNQNNNNNQNQSSNNQNQQNQDNKGQAPQEEQQENDEEQNRLDKSAADRVMSMAKEKRIPPVPPLPTGSRTRRWRRIGNMLKRVFSALVSAFPAGGPRRAGLKRHYHDRFGSTKPA